MKEHNRIDETAAELKRLELTLLDPEARRDTSRVAELLADDFLEFGSSGRVWTREATLKLLATETYVPPEIEDLSCRMLSDSVALLTYRSVRRSAGSEIQAEALRSSIWVRRQEGWKIRFHQGTRTERH